MLNYQPVPGGNFDLPEDAIHFDVGADGRIHAVGVDALWRESLPGSRHFLAVQVPRFGQPEFVRISPSGQKAIVGNYQENKIYIFQIGQSTANEVNATSYDAEWYNEQFVAVSNQGANGFAPPSEVLLLDTVAGTTRILINEIPGYSGGVTFDLDGSIYTGIGLAESPGPATGLIKAFRFSQWQSHLQGTGDALNFQTAGREAVNLLSAAFLTFDLDWNLCLGGGGGTGASGDPDMGFANIVSHSGLCRALYNQPPINSDAPESILQKLDPTPAQANEYWLINVNPVRREIYLKLYDAPEVTVFRPRLTRRLLRTDFQLGDNPGYYQGKRFVGMHPTIPLEFPDPAEFTSDLCIRLRTSFVETWANTQHQVTLNGAPIGVIEGGDFNEVLETTDITLSHQQAAQLLRPNQLQELAIAIDRRPGSGMADDFVLDSIEIITKPA